LEKKAAAGDFKRIAAMLTAVVAFSSGCAQIDEETPVNMGEATYDASPPVEINGIVFEGPPSTAASLSPALTEIICELGYGGNLTGVSVYCDFPESASNKENIGSAANPDVGAIIELCPELLLSQSPIAKKDIATIEEAGVRVLILAAPSNIDDLAVLYSDISAIFSGKRDTAAAAAGEVLEPLKKALAEAEGTVGTFVYILDDALSVAPPDTFIGDFFSHFGENVIRERGRLNLTREELTELAPEYVFVPEPLTIDDVYSLTGFSEQDVNVVVIGSDAAGRLERPSSRLSGVVYGILGDV
jgi:iron complex transport system substrate-binding protein